MSTFSRRELLAGFTSGALLLSEETFARSEGVDFPARLAKNAEVSPPPGALATALVAFKLPDSLESRAFRDLLLKKYGIVIKVAEKRWFNGIRISPHILNTELDIDAAIKAIRTEVG